MVNSTPDTDQLLDDASRGDGDARGQLLERHRDRLRRMIAVRLDRRLAARLDASDIVQETLVTAAARLDAYLRDRPVSFYPWLRRLAEERLADAYRHHMRARRSVAREEPLGLTADSFNQLAERLLAISGGASAGVRREERKALVRTSLERLSERDREVLVLRHLEQLSTAEAADVLGISESAVRVRLLRALQRLRDVLKTLGSQP